MSFAILFDMDGVLVDSIDLNKICWDETFKSYGATNLDNPLRGSTWEQLCKWAEEKNPRIKIPVEESMNKARNCQFEKLAKKEVRPGLIAFLEEMTERNIPMVVCTNSNMIRAEKFLEITGIKSFFKHVVSSCDVTNHKPHPEVFELGAKKLEKKKEECIVFEDTDVGVEAGKAAGMKVVGFHNEGQDIKNLKEADLIIDSFENIDFEILEELISVNTPKKY